jgi:ABC-type branched-subunit amino acid transport system substrate-binding protein
MLLAACQSGKVQTTPTDAQDLPPAAETESESTGDYLGAEFEGWSRSSQRRSVALLLPLSGQNAAVGQAMVNAAQLAVYDVADDDFVLNIYDTQGTSAGAGIAFRQGAAEGAGLVLGPLFGTSARALGPLASQAGINIMTFSNDRSVARPGTFVMGVAPEPQVVRIIDFAARAGGQRFAVLVPDNAYGRAIMGSAQEAIQRNGARLTKAEFYPPNTVDISDQVRRLADYERRQRALEAELAAYEGQDSQEARQDLAELETKDTLGPPDFEALLLAEGGGRVKALASLLAYYDVDPAEVKFLGTALWDDPGLQNEPSLQGAWFTASPPEQWRTFRLRYERAFGATPPRIATLAYDATALAAVLARQSPSLEGYYGIDRLTHPSGFAGIDGLFRFLPDGTIQRSYAVLEMGPGVFRVLDPAPASFGDLVN